MLVILATYAKGRVRTRREFAGFEEEAGMLVKRGVTAKTRPEGAAAWFLETAAEVSREIEAAEGVLSAGKIQGEQ